MPDWNKLVRERLGELQLPAAQQKEIVSELAAHLEDLYQMQLDLGMSEARALEYVMNESDWSQLAKDIHRVKRQEEIMNNRTKQVWIPALVSLAATMGWMMVLQITSSRLQMPFKHAGLAYWPYVVWFVTLPLIGALSGYLSIRAGANWKIRMTAVVFPCIVMMVMWLVLAGVIIVRKSPHPFQTLNFAYGFMLWVVAPAIALLLGTYFFQARPFSNSEITS